MSINVSIILRNSSCGAQFKLAFVLFLCLPLFFAVLFTFFSFPSIRPPALHQIYFAVARAQTYLYTHLELGSSAITSTIYIVKLMQMLTGILNRQDLMFVSCIFVIDVGGWVKSDIDLIKMTLSKCISFRHSNLPYFKKSIC